MLCSTEKYPSQLFLNVLLHILTLFIVLSILFMTYVSRIMTEVFSNEIGHSLIEAMRDVDVSPQSKALLKRLPIHIYDNEDPVKKVNNMWVFRILLTVIGFLVLLLCSVIYTIYRNCNAVQFKQILLENAITFLLVGTVEFIFFFTIVRKYIPVKPSMMKSYVMERLSR